MEIFRTNRDSLEIMAAKQNSGENFVIENTNWNDAVLKSGHRVIRESQRGILVVWKIQAELVPEPGHV